VLEAEEETPGRPFGGVETGDVLALEEDAAAGHLIGGTGQQRLGQC
jgi:hypothetical protein